MRRTSVVRVAGQLARRRCSSVAGGGANRTRADPGDGGVPRRVVRERHQRLVGCLRPVGTSRASRRRRRRSSVRPPRARPRCGGAARPCRILAQTPDRVHVGRRYGRLGADSGQTARCRSPGRRCRRRRRSALRRRSTAPRGRATLPLAGRTIAIDPGHQLGNSRHLAEIDRLVWVGHLEALQHDRHGDQRRLPGGHVHLAHLAGPEAAARGARRDRADDPDDEQPRRLGTVRRHPRPVRRQGRRRPGDLAARRRGRRGHPRLLRDPTRGCGPGWTDDILGRSRAFALRVRAGLVGAGFGVSTAYGGDGLDVRRDLGTLNAADVPTVMVELGNMRNAGDARCMTSASLPRPLRRGLADGVAGAADPIAGCGPAARCDRMGPEGDR